MKDSSPIMIVDDSAVERYLLESNLTNAGYDIVVADNGQMAMDILGQ